VSPGPRPATLTGPWGTWFLIFDSESPIFRWGVNTSKESAAARWRSVGLRRHGHGNSNNNTRHDIAGAMFVLNFPFASR